MWPLIIAPLKPSLVTARSSSSRGGGGVGDRQRRETGEAVGMRLDRLEQNVVDLTRDRNGRRRVERLAAGLIVRQHLHVDASRVHGGKPRVAQVEQIPR